MQFGLRNGPWNVVFAGEFQGHEMEIVANPEQVMLVSIYEKTGQEYSGVVMQTFRVYSAVGELETFVESLEQEAVILSRHDGKRTIQFLALAGKPGYAKAGDEEVAALADRLMAAIQAFSKRTIDVAKSFDVHLTPLGESSGATKQAFFSQPMVLPMLAREKETIAMEKEEAEAEKGIVGTAVMLGTTKDGKMVREPLQMFQRTLVTDGTVEQRNAFIRIFVESFLLGNVPVVVFERGNSLSGIDHPTEKMAELQSHGVDIEPIGFPTKVFEPGRNIGINLNAMNAASILEMFGCDDKEAEKILSRALGKGNLKGIPDLAAHIESFSDEEEVNQFLKRRLERIALLVDAIYPGLFSGPNDIEEIAKTWFRKIGRASIVKMDAVDPRAFIFIVDGLANELLGIFRKQGEAKNPRILVAIPDISPVFAIKRNPTLQDLEKALAEMKKFGIGFVIGSERRSDLGKEMLVLMETKASVVKENDVAIDLPNSKNYRIVPRPSLSRPGN